MLVLFWALRRSSLILIWVLIELNLLLFLPMLVFSSGLFRGTSGLKFFFIQRAGGLLVLIFIVLLRQGGRKGLLAFTSLSLLLKIGGFPFHQWLISLRRELRWERLLVLLTIQKSVPLFLVTSLSRGVLILISVVGWGAIRTGGLLVKQIKKIFILSSVFFLGAILLATLLGGWGWKRLLVLYFRVFFSFSILEGGEKGAPRGAPRANSVDRALGWLIVILSLRGIPPFPRFFLKLEVLRSLWEHAETLVRLIFILRGGVFLYIYITLLFWFLLLNQGLKTEHRKRKLGLIVGVAPSVALWVLT